MERNQFISVMIGLGAIFGFVVALQRTNVTMSLVAFGIGIGAITFAGVTVIIERVLDWVVR